MADIDQQQLQKALRDITGALQSISTALGGGASGINSNITRVSGVLSRGSQTISSAIDQFNEALQSDEIERARSKALEEYKKTLEGQTSFRRWYEDDSKRERLQRETENALNRKALQMQLEVMVKDNKQSAVKLRNDRKLALEAVAAAQQALDDKKREQLAGALVGQDVFDQLQAELESREAHLAELNDHRRALLQDQQRGKAQLRSLTGELAAGEARIKNARLGAVTEQMREKMGTWVSNLVSGATAMSLFTKAVMDTLDTIRGEMKYATRLDPQSQLDTARLGVSRAEYAALTGEYRRTIGTMGGLQQATDRLAAEQKDYYKLTGDLKEATEVQLQAYQMLTNNGIQMSDKEMRDYSAGLRKSYDEIRFKTGLTMKQFTDTLRELEDDESTRVAMRLAANEQERRQIMANNQARIKENLAMGMTREQAVAAAKAMGKMAAEKPIDRFKKSMKLQMAMGAMGISGGEEAARIYRKSENNRTAEEKRYLQGRLSDYSNKMSTQLGSEDLGTAAYAEKIGEKSGFTEEALADLNTKGLQPLKASVDNLDKTLREASESRLAGKERELAWMVDLVKSVLVNVPAVGVVVGGIAAVMTLTKLLRGGALFAGLGNVLGKIFKRSGPGARIADGATDAMADIGTNAASRAGGALGGLGRGIAGLGRGAGSAVRGVLAGLASGLKQLAHPKVFVGIGALTALAIPLWTTGKAIKQFAGVKWSDMSKAAAALAGLAVTGAAVGFAAKPMLIGAAALAALGGAAWIVGQAAQVFAQAFQTFAQVKWDQLGAGLGKLGTGLADLWNNAPNPAKLALLAASIIPLGLSLLPLAGSLALLNSDSLAQLGTSLASIGDGLGQLWDKSPNPVKIAALAASIAPLGVAMLPLASSIAMIDTDKMGAFVDKMAQLANLDAGKIKAVASAIREVNDASTPSVGSIAKTAVAGIVDKFVGQNQEDKKDTKDTATKSDESTQQIVSTINQQLAKMDKSNEYLKVLAENMPTLVQLANKQLEATLLPEAKKEDRQKTTKSGSGFGAIFNPFN